ncbi:MAG: hypothetical protein JWR13_6165 [Mycobacterium sp.]|nr:hypothetical protein [Mycobacterium sp.]
MALNGFGSTDLPPARPPTIRTLGLLGIVLRSLRDGIDTSNAAGRMVGGVLASVAELELELERERKSAAKAARQAGGLPIGRPKALDSDNSALARPMRDSGEPVQVIAETMGVRHGTVYRHLSEGGDK